MTNADLEEDFQFDAQGFLIIRQAFDADSCHRYLEELDRLFELDYEDAWLRVPPP